MRRFPSMILLAAVSSLAVNGSVAHANDAESTIISSSANGALLPPDEWDCNRYVAEYRDFLKAGNAPESWRFVGKRYRVDKTGDLYDWKMWLDWQEEQNCFGQGAAQSSSSQGSGSGSGSGGGGGGMSALGIVGGVLAAGAAAAAAGGGGGGGSDTKPPPKSPG